MLGDRRQRSLHAGTKCSRDAPGDQVRDRRPRRVDRDTGRQPPEHEQHAEPGILDDVGIPLLAGRLELRHERHPHLGASRIVEAVRHHADHRVDAVAKPERPPDDGPVAAEPALPGAVAEDGDAGTAQPVVLRLQRPPHGRLRAGQRKERGRHRGDRNRRRFAFLQHEAPGGGAHRGQLLEPPRLLLPQAEGRVGHLADRRRRAFAGPDHHDAIGIAHRQRPQQHLVHDGECRDARTDGQGQRAHRDRRQPRRAAQPAKRETDVAEHQVSFDQRLTTNDQRVSPDRSRASAW